MRNPPSSRGKWTRLGLVLGATQVLLLLLPLQTQAKTFLFQHQDQQANHHHHQLRPIRHENRQDMIPRRIPRHPMQHHLAKRRKLGMSSSTMSSSKMSSSSSSRSAMEGIFAGVPTVSPATGPPSPPSLAPTRSSSSSSSSSMMSKSKSKMSKSKSKMSSSMKSSSNTASPTINPMLSPSPTTTTPASTPTPTTATPGITPLPTTPGTTPLPTTPGATVAPQERCSTDLDTCADNPEDIPVNVDLQIQFEGGAFAACNSQQEEDLIKTTIVQALTGSFCTTVSDWQGAVEFGEFDFDFDQEVNNANPFARTRKRQRHLLRRRRLLGDSSNGTTVADARNSVRYLQDGTSCASRNEVPCDTADFCRWGCLVAATTSCGVNALTNWVRLGSDIAAALRFLNIDCLGIPDELQAVVLVEDRTAPVPGTTRAPTPLPVVTPQPTEANPDSTPAPTEAAPGTTPTPTVTTPGTTPAPTEANPGITPAPTEANPGMTPAPTEATPGVTPAPTEANPGVTPAPTEANPGATSAPTEATPGATAAPTEATPGATPTPTEATTGTTAAPTEAAIGTTPVPTVATPGTTAAPTEATPAVTLAPTEANPGVTSAPTEANPSATPAPTEADPETTAAPTEANPVVTSAPTEAGTTGLPTESTPVTTAAPTEADPGVTSAPTEADPVSTGSPTEAGETPGSQSCSTDLETCTDQPPVDFKVAIDIQIEFEGDEFVACNSQEEEDEIRANVASAMNDNFCTTVSDWQGAATFGEFDFDFDQEVNNVDPFDGFRHRALMAEGSQRSSNIRILQDGTTCLTREGVDCTADYCRWGCLTAVTTSCGTNSLANWANLGEDIAERLASLNIDCLGIPEQLQAVVILDDHTEVRSGNFGEVEDRESGNVGTGDRDATNDILTGSDGNNGETATDATTKTLQIKGELDFQFFNGTIDEPPSDEDIEGLIEETKRFYRDHFRNHHDFKDIFVTFAMDQVTDQFTPNTTIGKRANDTPQDVFELDFVALVEIMEGHPGKQPNAKDVALVMANSNYKKFIDDYVWEAPPLQLNEFYNTRWVRFTAYGVVGHGPHRM